MNGVEHEARPLAMLRSALADFYIQDRALLALSVGEQAVTFRLGHHLISRAGAAWHVDAEYDRESEDGNRKVRDEPRGRHMRPDLVVHRRGQRGRSNNLMFLEVKHVWRPDGGDSNDLDKVGVAVARHQYQFGITLGLSLSDSSGRFSPTWTVCAWSHEASTFLAKGEAVFDDLALRQLEKVASTQGGVRI